MIIIIFWLRIFKIGELGWWIDFFIFFSYLLS